MRENKRVYVLILEVIAILGAIASIIQAFYIGRIVDSTKEGVEMVRNMVVIIFITMAVEVVTKISQQYLANSYLNKKRWNLKKMITEKLLGAKYKELETVETGNILNIYNSDIEKILKYEQVMFSIGATLIKIMVSLGYLLYMDVMVSGCIIIASFMALIPGMLIGNLQYGKQKQLNKQDDALNQFFLRNMSLVKLIKSYNAENNYQQKNQNYLNQYKKSKNLLNNNVVLYNVLNRVCGLLPFLALFLVGGIFVVKGRFTIGNIVAASFFIGILGEGIEEIQNVFSVKQVYKASKERIGAIMELQQQKEKRKKIFSKESAIQFKNVGFQYADGKSVFQNLNLQIPEKSKILIKGKSGSGKTTFLRLIEGLYEPTEGTVEFGQEPVLSAAEQETILFPRTVKENIAVGNENLTEEKIAEICKVVCIDETILQTEGVERIVAVLENNLSKGQRQRINLARALARDAEVYLFDEPTAGLTAEMAEQVITNMITYLQDKTVIMIMHESGQEKLFDRVMEMNGYI